MRGFSVQQSETHFFSFVSVRDQMLFCLFTFFIAVASADEGYSVTAPSSVVITVPFNVSWTAPSVPSSTDYIYLYLCFELHFMNSLTFYDIQLRFLMGNLKTSKALEVVQSFKVLLE